MIHRRHCSLCLIPLFYWGSLQTPGPIGDLFIAVSSSPLVEWFFSVCDGDLRGTNSVPEVRKECAHEGGWAGKYGQGGRKKSHCTGIPCPR